MKKRGRMPDCLAALTLSAYATLFESRPTYTHRERLRLSLPSFASTLTYEYGMSEAALTRGDSTDFTRGIFSARSKLCAYTQIDTNPQDSQSFENWYPRIASTPCENQLDVDDFPYTIKSMYNIAIYKLSLSEIYLGINYLRNIFLL